MTTELSRFLDSCRKRQPSPVLGGRELEVMKILWREGALSAQQVLQSISDSTLSLSTMQSTLERLHRKSLLHRQKSGRRYIYRTAVSRSVFISQLMMDIAETIGDGEMAPMVSGFVNYIDYESPESLTEEVREIIGRLPTQSDD
ncbi:MAG: BlaI/MecI/CopY family transcriptional regulator [Candidatus Thiodiazotropha sp. (ex. Lucinisca nassula)]|nr:BlaI/MecI/CopY family transcriptional regulator [Candidatus Thiodiazotropha sp. (ex. Lucinisca nassula)]MBW9260552.1 BlaI/MecI/CopY family transcriptional regulator [Candidatus Thiodiazotropha sp. (ex. Lucinisca nassula)]MBW9268471.1 BlaI/MecI/CopY family transcriptional regulator [Candidatus Thiodiazotropha sp. (ex. Lucinisca nassula)]MCG7866275.1 BlaI/MecI/CopY family transcriptional regulator [Candidatus Thiodiazotropha taylori]RLW70707.1 MAG: hypothetical protein B6D71_05390 [gamma prote